MIRYNYLMLKPESQKKFPEIYDEIQRKKIGSIKLYGVTDWTSLSKKLYENQLKTNKEFEASFMSLAYTINYLFGNEAIIVLIKNIYNNENFESDILQFKREIREKYSESDRLYLVINMAKIDGLNVDKAKISEIVFKDKLRKFEEKFKNK